MNHRFALIAIAVILFQSPLAARTPTFGLKPIDDFSALAQTNSAATRPLLLVFTADDCPYCEQLAEEILLPMIRSGDYESRVRIRALNLNGGPVRDFAGRSVDPWEFALRYKVSVTPTMVLLDRRGEMLVDPLAGVRTVVFYEAIIAQAIDRANRRLSELYPRR